MIIFDDYMEFNGVKKIKKSLKVLEGLLRFLPEGTYVLRDMGPNRYKLFSKENDISMNYKYNEGKCNDRLLPDGYTTNPSPYEVGKILYKFLSDLDVDIPLDAVMFSLPVNYSNIHVEEPKFGVYWLVVK